MLFLVAIEHGSSWQLPSRFSGRKNLDWSTASHASRAVSATYRDPGGRSTPRRTMWRIIGLVAEQDLHPGTDSTIVLRRMACAAFIALLCCLLLGKVAYVPTNFQ